jgi:hypothetical protein
MNFDLVVMSFNNQNKPYSSYVTKKYQKFFECLLVAAASAFTGFLTLFVVDDCQPMGVNPFITEMTKVRSSINRTKVIKNF